MQAPAVILLDIDGTLIGDITPQIIMYELTNAVKPAFRLPYAPKHLQLKLKEGIIRPHFKSFFEDLSRHGVEFFIYTASEKKWAEHIVKNIENTLNIKFNRPIFTRNNCEIVNRDIKKSIKAVKPMVVKTLRRKYPMLKKEDLRNIIAIDNRPVYNVYDSRYLVLCDTYDYRIPENIPSVLTKQMYDRHNVNIYNILSKYYSNMKHTSNYMKFEKQFYYNYIDELSNAIKIKPHAMNDNLFKIIRNIVIGKNIQSFNEQFVQYVNNKCQHPNLVYKTM